MWWRLWILHQSSDACVLLLMMLVFVGLLSWTINLIGFQQQPLPFGQHFECQFSYFCPKSSCLGSAPAAGVGLSQRFGQKADVECVASFLSWFLPHFAEVEVALNSVSLSFGPKIL